MRCERARRRLPAVADGSAELRGPARAHVQRCLRCQAELAQHRRVLRTLRSLRDEQADPAPGLVAEVLAAVERGAGGVGAGRPGHRHRTAYLGGLAVAVAAGVGAAVLAVRGRRRADLAVVPHRV